VRPALGHLALLLLGGLAALALRPAERDAAVRLRAPLPALEGRA
jgi:hypothetical protein